MADSYSFVKSGKLKLKGHKDKSKKHKKHKSRKRELDADEDGNSEDALRHGGWWEVKGADDIIGSLAIEMGSMRYLEAQDNGLFSLGSSHSAGEGPNPEEILTAIKLDESKIVFKSGFDKYLSVDSKGRVVGRSDAISSKEQFQAVFQDGNVAVLGCNSCFITVTPEGSIVCDSPTAGEDQFLKIRCCVKRDKRSKTDNIPAEDKGTLKESEVEYVKKFQSFQDRRLRVTGEHKSALKQGRTEGKLHEVMLDRREKMKSDRYCK